jgi:diacylglycerol kinase
MDKSDKKFHTGSFSLAQRLKSFRYAFRGIVTLLKHEHNARIHLFLLIIVIIAGVLLRLTETKWLAILFVTGLVFISECFNTAIEYLSDQITGEENENIRKAKDVAAAGVLIAAAISVVTGIIIFLPELVRLFR